MGLLEQAVLKRPRTEELEDTDGQLQAVNQKQAKSSKTLAIQGGIDITDRRRWVPKIQNEKIDRHLKT